MPRKSFSVNRLAGVVPTASVFDVDPTDLGKATDGNWLVGTGQGVKTIAANGNTGVLYFDMGAVYNVLLRGIIEFESDVGGLSALYLYSSYDALTWREYAGAYGTPGVCWLAVATKTPFDFGVPFVRARHIQLASFGGNGAGTYKFGVVNLEAIEHF